MAYTLAEGLTDLQEPIPDLLLVPEVVEPIPDHHHHQEVVEPIPDPLLLPEVVVVHTPEVVVHPEVVEAP